MGRRNPVANRSAQGKREPALLLACAKIVGVYLNLAKPPQDVRVDRLLKNSLWSQP